MKKHFLSLALLLLTLFSCNTDLEDFTPAKSTDLTTRAAGDRKYDLLGYGYDCTLSAFKGSVYGKLQVIDLDRLKSGLWKEEDYVKFRRRSCICSVIYNFFLLNFFT